MDCFEIQEETENEFFEEGAFPTFLEPPCICTPSSFVFPLAHYRSLPLALRAPLQILEKCCLITETLKTLLQ